jgi:hypothetical protein
MLHFSLFKAIGSPAAPSAPSLKPLVRNGFLLSCEPVQVNHHQRLSCCVEGTLQQVGSPTTCPAVQLWPVRLLQPDRRLDRLLRDVHLEEFFRGPHVFRLPRRSFCLLLLPLLPNPISDVLCRAFPSLSQNVRPLEIPCTTLSLSGP